MSHAPSPRIIVITSILFALTAIAVSADWGRGFGSGLFASNEEARSVGGSLPALSGTKAVEYLKQNRQYDSLKEAFAATKTALRVRIALHRLTTALHTGQNHLR